MKPDIRRSFTRKAFRAWLADRPPQAGVGCSHSAGDCPFARYLRSLGLDQVGVHQGVFMYRTAAGRRRDEGSAWANMPHWLESFVARIDADDVRYRPVRAKQALALLDEEAA